MNGVLNPQTLPKNDNLSRFAYALSVDENVIIQKGKMIAYYGKMKFESIGSSLLDIIVREAFRAPLYLHDYVVATGPGQLILGDQANDIAGYDVEDANFTIRANNLLALPPTIRCQESTIPGFLTLIGSGRIVASSNGPVHFIEPPCCVDEQAILGWADCPSPSYRYDYDYVKGFTSAVGALTGFSLSGEEKQLDFNGKGTVMVQSSELELQGRGVVSAIISQLGRLNPADLGMVSAALNQRISGKG